MNRRIKTDMGLSVHGIPHMLMVRNVYVRLVDGPDP